MFREMPGSAVYWAFCFAERKIFQPGEERLAVVFYRILACRRRKFLKFRRQKNDIIERAIGTEITMELCERPRNTRRRLSALYIQRESDGGK